ncbi:MAG: plastocyanin/azurin family copper-binding protein [Thermoleophilia bacterium]|nr:plastocyanin/azurin family copper-binding protein [Thermoleophilia bacterium]
MTRRTRTIVVSALAGASLMAAAGVAGAATYNVTAGDLFFRGMPKSVPAGTHTFVLKNTGNAPHDLKIGTKKTKILQKGQTGRVTVTLKKGKVSYICTVPGHAQAGMKGTLTVK